MKSCILATVLLGSVGRASEAEHPSLVMNTWCTTYLSTYLVPISAPPGIFPSRHLTFFGNGSTAVGSSITSRFAIFVLGNTDIVLGTRDQTFIAPESRTTAIGDGSSDVIPTEAQTDSETPPTVINTGPSTEPIDTSSASPTSTGIVEPQGRAVILLIQQTIDNQRRGIKKRAAEGFVGANNPDICTFALTFNLAEGQLFAGGSPTFYAGEDFKPFGFPCDDSIPQGAITKTFATSGRTLVFKNSGLPNDEAGFCLDASGETYITFTSSPAGCIPVILDVYDGEDNSDEYTFAHANCDTVDQCQNGRLVGVDTLTSSSAVSTDASITETASFASTSSEETTIAATTESTESNPFSSTDPSNTLSETGSKIFTTASSDIVTSSITIQSTIPASDSSTGVLASTETESTTSTVEMSTEITSIPSESSTSKSLLEPASLVSSATFGEIIPTTTTTISEAPLETTESTAQASVTSSESIETSTPLMSTSEEPTSETTTAEETTPAEETTTTAPTLEITDSSTETTADTTTEVTIPDTTTELITTTTAAAQSECQGFANPYTVQGVNFNLSCDTKVGTGALVGTAEATDFQQCIYFCAVYAPCVAVSYERSIGDCTGYGSNDGTVADNAFDTAIRA